MLNNKLICLLKCLSEQELRELKLFVRSPFHNQREDVVQLFDALRKMNLEKLTEEKLYAKAFSNGSFDKRQLAYVMNYLMKVIEDYFAIQELQKDKAKRQFLIAKAALAHQQPAIFQQKIKKAKAALQSHQLHNLETLELEYQLDMQLYNQQKNQVRDGSLNLKKPSQYLDNYLIGMQLRQACFLLAHENLSEVNYEHDLLQYLLDYLEMPAQTDLLKVPLIALYYFSYQTLKKEQPADFQQLSTLLEQYKHQFTKADLKDFYSIGLNFCIKQLNQGKTEYVREAFEWYRKALQEEVLLEHGILSQFHYKNIAALGLGLKEFAWVETFLVDYKTHLEAHLQDLSFNYNFAKLHYEKGDYKAAMHLLQAVKYSDSLPNLTSKILLMKIYYELGEYEVLSSYLKSFEGSVRRQRKLGYHKKNYLNLISIMRKLLNVNTFDKTAIQKVRKAILEIEILPEKKWLLEQITLR